MTSAKQRHSRRPRAVAEGLPPGRRWMFRLIACLLIPLVCVLVAEWVLRLGGYGYPTDFFRESTVQGRPVLIENSRFGWRFFPQHLARTPQPLLLADPKPADTCRIFFFGESAAMGDPEPDFGPPRALEVLLRERFPGRQIEVVNVAMTAINSHAVREIAHDCASREGDVWIVYMGNNEVIGPYGAGTVFNRQVPSYAGIRFALQVRRTRLGQLFESGVHALAPRNQVPRTWTGLKMFQDYEVPLDDPRLKAVRDNYRKNLEEIVRLGRGAGAKVVVCTVATNLRDCAPFGSRHRAGLAESQLRAWNEHYTNGIVLESAGRYEAARDRYHQAANIDESFAALPFRLGRCASALGNTAEARDAFKRALDHDTLRFRSDEANNEIIRRVAAGRQHEGVHLVDVAGAFAAHSADGVPGRNLFWEHVHFNFSGTYLVAKTLLRQVEEFLPESAGKDGRTGALLTETECARRLGYSRWNEQKIVAEIAHRQQSPPCTAQANHEENLAFLQRKLAESRLAIEPSALLSIATAVRAMVQTNGFDWVLRKNLAQLLEAGGDLPAALQEWKQVAQMMPHYANARYHLGNLLDIRGQSAEAEPHFRKALELDPAMAEAWSGLGLSLAARGRYDEAFRAYAQAVAANPDSIHAYINWGLGLANQGKFNDAISKYREALRLNPDNPLTHGNLGVALAATGRHQDAASHYSRALQLKPDFVHARLNLARELVRLGRATEAVPVLEAGIAVASDASRLRFELALAYEQLGRVNDAVRELNETLRVSPDNAEAQEVLARLRGPRATR